MPRRNAMFTVVSAVIALSGVGAATWSNGQVAAYAPGTATVFISEIHYDNAGADAGEAVEVYGPAGTSLVGWTVVPHNGSGGASYTPAGPLSGTIPNEAGSGFGAVSVAILGLQNGAPDGLALVDNLGTVRQFLSYEGAFTATNGAANGVASTDILVSEAGTEPAGQSLQLTRIAPGNTYSSFAWSGPAAASFGLINGGPPAASNCPDTPAVTLIHVLQGTTDTSPCSLETVTIEGVVVGDYEGAAPTLRGFYVQEQDADADADPATSEGVFVFNANNNSVALGDVVQVTGTVEEFQGQTQIGTVTAITVVGAGGTVTPATVSLPVPSATFLERVEGMKVTVPQTLYVTEHFQLGRFGQVVVSSGDVLPQPTANVAPGAAAIAAQAANNLNRLIIDDELNNQNPDPIIYGRGGNQLSASNTLRGGDTTTGATGVMTYTWAGNSASGNAYRLRPAPTPPVFVAANARPSDPPAVGGSLNVAAMNVLNYFLTLDAGTNQCGPVGFQQDCRGAETADELTRQRDKLLAVLDKIDADVMGLVELENTTGVDPIGDIVNGLNAINGPGTYAAINTGTIGTDAIRVGLIYKPAVVVPVGAFATIDSSVIPAYDSSLNRPALAQTFQQLGTGEVLTVVVNHLKSKSCTGATGIQADQGDGQGCWNPARTAAAQAEAAWLATDPTGSGDPDYLILGDLNSYAKEDPITAFADGGYVDLADTLITDPYSYVFDGQWGYLDYALASASIAAQVAGAGEYHINSDEPSVLDYNTNFKSAGQIASLYAADEFRTSDHDPVVVGLALTSEPDPEIPEAPVGVLLGISALVLLGGGAMIRRNRLLPVRVGRSG